jgi:hypothetical protein
MHFDYKDNNARGVMGGNSKKTNIANVRPSEVALLFVEVGKKIRVLNALRDPTVGFAMTVAQ